MQLHRPSAELDCTVMVIVDAALAFAGTAYASSASSSVMALASRSLHFVGADVEQHRLRARPRLEVEVVVRHVDAAEAGVHARPHRLQVITAAHELGRIGAAER